VRICETRRNRADRNEMEAGNSQVAGAYRANLEERRVKLKVIWRLWKNRCAKRSERGRVSLRGVMATQEIPRDEWLTFLDSFSREHQGWLVDLEIISPGKGTQVEAKAMPLVGITAGVNRSDGEAVHVTLGKAPEDHLTHTVRGVSHVRLRESDEGAHEAV